MISDILSDAAVEIRRYLHSPTHAPMYQGQTRRHIEQLLIAMDSVRARLDQPPPMEAPQSTMTIEQFRSTKQWCTNFGDKLKDAGFEDGARGWVYCDVLFIDEVLESWPEAAQREGRWHLILGRDEYISNDLENLEQRLFEWARDEGYEVAQ